MTEKNKTTSIPLPSETPRDYVSLETNPKDYVSLENSSSEKQSYKDLLNTQQKTESQTNNTNQTTKPQQASENKNQFMNFLGLQYSPETNKVKQTSIAQRLLGNFNYFKQEQENKPKTNLKNDIAFPKSEKILEAVNAVSGNDSRPKTGTPQDKFLGIRNEQGMPLTPQTSAYQAIREKLIERAKQNRESGRLNAFSNKESSALYKDIARAKNFDRENVKAAKENNLPAELSGEKYEKFAGNLKNKFLKSSLQTPEMNPYKQAAIAVSSKTAQDNFLGIRDEQGMPMQPPNNVGSSSSTNSVASPPSNKRQRNDTVLQVSLTRMSYPLWMIQGLVG